jgi:hypothetical protein
VIDINNRKFVWYYVNKVLTDNKLINKW